MDPLQSIAKAVTGATLDKLQQIVERDQTSEDAKRDKQLKDELESRVNARIADAARRLRD